MSYLAGMWFFKRFSPIRAYKDLRLFLSHREPHELYFLIAAMVITGFFIYAFAKDSYAERAYRPEIIYVQQWPANRTEAQILAQQKIDGPIEAKRKAEIKAARERRQAQFRKLDKAMTDWGI